MTKTMTKTMTKKRTKTMTKSKTKTMTKRKTKTMTKTMTKTIHPLRASRFTQRRNGNCDPQRAQNDIESFF